MLVTLAGAAAQGRSVVESILVRVNDRIVTTSDFRKRLEMELSQPGAPTEREAIRQFARRLFEEIVNEMILLERAEEKRLSIDDEMVDRQIAALREENNLQDDRQFEEALRGAGLTVQQLRDRYRQSMLLTRVAQSEVTPTQLTEEEVRQRYEANREDYRIPEKVELEQVFFPVAADGADRSQVVGRARGLVTRVRDGNDLRAEATLAGVEMQELGAIPVRDLRPDLLAAIEGLQEGGVTDPLETAGGVQVIRLVRRVPSSYQPFEEVREAIRRQISAERYEQQTRGVVERLKEDYLVEVHEERLVALLDQITGAA
jgi:parvulin-like peptidyl-prolyl isomerase